MIDPARQALLAARAAPALAITPQGAAKELEEARQKLVRGLQKVAQVPEEALAIATVPREEVWRCDMVRLYRSTPVAKTLHRTPILITYALVGRFQMIDLEADRSLVRKLVASGRLNVCR